MATATNGQILNGLYAAIYVRSPDKAGYDYWTAGFTAGTLTTRGAATAFSARTEWAAAYPTALSDTAYVDKIYQNVLGIVGDAGGRKYWADLITAKTVTRTDFVADFIKATIEFDATLPAFSALTAAEKASSLSAQATINSKVSFSESWLANTAVSSNSTLTGVDSTGGYIASVDKSVTLLGGVSDAATLATQLPKISAAAATGTTFTLTAGTDTFTALTALNDTVTGAAGTLGSDIIIDSTTTDADVLTATSSSSTITPTITKIETLDISDTINPSLNLTNVSGATTLNLSATVATSSATAKVTNAKVGAVTKIVAGANVGTLDVATASAGTGTGDLALDTGSATSVVLTGGAGTDNFALTTTGNITIKAGGTAKSNSDGSLSGLSESLKLAANPVATTGTATAATPVITLDTTSPLLSYTPAIAATTGVPEVPASGGTLDVTSTGAVEIKADITHLSGRTVTASGGGKVAVSFTGTSPNATQDLSKFAGVSANLTTDLGASATVKLVEGSTLGVAADQAGLIIAGGSNNNIASATIADTAPKVTALSSNTVKNLTLNSAAAVATSSPSAIDTTYTNINLAGTTSTSTTANGVTTTTFQPAGNNFGGSKIILTGGTTAAPQDVQVASGKAETVDASALVGTLDYTHSNVIGYDTAAVTASTTTTPTVASATSVASNAVEKFVFTGSAGADKVTVAAPAVTPANTSVKVNFALNGGAGDDTITLPGVKYLSGSTITVDGGVGADTLVLAKDADLSEATVNFAGLETVSFATAGGTISLSAAQVSGQTYNVKGSAATDDVFTVKSVSTTASVDLTKLVFDTAVEKIAIDGSKGSTAGQTLSGLISTSIPVKHAITGGNGPDVITGGIASDTIRGGGGVDTLTGGPATASGNDTFVFAGGDSSTTTPDTITDFEKSSAVVAPGTSVIKDKIHVVDATTGADVTLSSIVPALVNSTATSAKAAININSVATFDAADSTLALKVVAVNATLATSPAGTSVVWSDGGDTYFYSRVDGAAGLKGTNDILVKLKGVAADALANFVNVPLVSTGTTLGVDTYTDDNGNNKIDLLAGDDTYLDGSGNVSLTGGSGNDTFNFVKGGADTITDLGGIAGGEADVLNVANIVDGSANKSLIATIPVTAGWVAGAATVNNGTVTLTTKVAGGTTISLANVTAPGAGTWIIDSDNGTAKITGSASADTFVYTTSAKFVTSGGTVLDTIAGGASDDTISIQGGITIETATDLAGVTAVEKLVAATSSATNYNHEVTIDDTAKLSSFTTIDLSGDTNTTSTGKIVIAAGTTPVLTLKGVNGGGNNTITGGDGADTIIAGKGANTVTGAKGSDTITLNTTASAADKVVFADTAANNGTDAVTGFSATNDVLDFTAFMTTKDVTGGAADATTLGLTIASSLDFSTNKASIITLKDVQALTSANFSATAASATVIKTAATDKFVVLTDLVSAADGSANIYYVDIASSAATVTLVGTVNATDVGGWLTGAFA